jgi:DNA mismatch repair protein MutL
MAVKEGEELDDRTAAGLVQDILNLDQTRCPHGRPIWVEVSQEELLRKVART